MKQKLAKSATQIFSLLFALLCCQFMSAQNWTMITGVTAQDVAVGKDGTVWATATNGNIYRWNGSSWQTMPGGASRIAVDPSGIAWVINSNGNIYKYNSALSNGWELKPGLASDIGIGADGSVWVIGRNTVPGGYDIYKWNGSNWSTVPGGALRIAVDPEGKAWVVNNSGTVFHFNGTSWDVKPGNVKDIGVGANGAIWCTGADLSIYQWDGSNWKMQSGGAAQISVAPDGNAWVVNAGGQIYHSLDAVSAVVTVRTIFPRGQTYEYRMLQALKIVPYSNTVTMGATPQFANIDPLGQAFGRLGLLASEIYFVGNSTINAEGILGQIGSFSDDRVRQSVWGILAVLVMNEAAKNGSDAQTTAIKKWAADLYRSIRIRCAKSLLDEYEKWKADWCTYEGVPPEKCRIESQGIASLFTTRKPPQDLIGKNGLKNAVSGNTDALASTIALSLSAITMTAAGLALTSVLGGTLATLTGVTGSVAAVTGVSLTAAFGGSAGMAGAAGGAIGAMGWAGVVAAPVAAAVLCIVVGTMEGFAVVEAAKVEPMFKMKLGAAITDYININNIMADSSARQMFFIAFQEAAKNGFQVTQPKVDGEVRFYCQAGYVSSFRLSYTVNGQNQSFTTPDLSVGYEKTFPIPYNATNIKVHGSYALAGWKDLFDVSLAQPTYMCYTSYGTVFAPSYKTDCPEVGNMTTNKNQLTVTQGGGYVAWVRLEYNDGGQTKRVIDKNDCGGGWRQVFDIPATATNIHLVAWAATGLVWDPWKTIIDKSWPSPPNECIKVYNTTLDPKWDNECK